jgi:hypothetical protein
MSAEDKDCPNCGEIKEAGGSGATVHGNVTVTQGDFVGRDQMIRGDSNRSYGVGAAELSTLFQAVYRQIDAHAADPEADVDTMRDTTKKIEQEAAKGEEADQGNLRRWLTTLGKIAPDVLELVVNALINPGAAVSSAVRQVISAFQRA